MSIDTFFLNFFIKSWKKLRSSAIARERHISGETGFRSFIPDASGFPVLKKGDLTPVLIIFLYCASYAILRLLVSPAMELDEAEQFINGAAFHLGYAHQAPLYTWIVWLVSLVSGRGLVMLVLLKYGMLLLFYISFYLVARIFWEPGESLLATGCLLLFPIYSYETNRDLSNTVLLSLMAVVSCYFFLRLLFYGTGCDYILFGASCGLGMLSKYNFVFCLSAMLLFGVTDAYGRRAVFNKKIFLSTFIFLIMVLPHFLWLAHNGFSSVQYVYKLSSFGLPKGRSFPIFLFSAYLEVILFLLVFQLFLGRQMSFGGLFRAEQKSGAEAFPGYLSPKRIFPALALYGLAVPLAGIIIFNPAHFQSRWLTPVYFTLPLAGFSMLKSRSPRAHFAYLGYLCMTIAAVVFAVRALAGFFPDVTGKTERIHIPYPELSRQLETDAMENGIKNLRGLTVVSCPEDSYIAANILAAMPGAFYIPLHKAALHPEALDDGGIFICRQGKSVPSKFLALFPGSKEETVSSPYLHSNDLGPFTLKALIISPGSRRLSARK